MPPETITQTRFALEGFLPLWSVGLLGIGLLALSWWMATRDRRFADRPWAVWFLFTCRALAVLVLLWILAGPTLVTSLNRFRPKSLAILVDHSASMNLVDIVDGSGNVSRWAAARHDGGSGEIIRRVDEAVSIMRAAHNALDRFSRIPNSAGNAEAARALLKSAVDGLESGVEALREGRAAIEGSTRPDLASHLEKAGKEVGPGVIDELKAKSAEFNRGKTLASLGRASWLPERMTRVAAALIEAERVADELVRSLESPDGTGAYRLADAESKLSRFDKVEALMAAAERGWLGEVRKKAIVNRYEFGDTVVPMGSAPWEESDLRGDAPRVPAASTQIGAALQQIALDHSSAPVAAAILITDGGQNAGRDPRELAPSLAGTRLHIVPIGNTRMQRDVILHHTHAPRIVLQNDEVVIDSIVTAYECANEKLAVELLEGGSVVDRQVLNVTGQVLDSRVQLRWKAAQLGRHSLGFRVVPVPDERTEENNTATVDIQVMEDEIRVLVADNYPRWETRYLLNLFKRDERVIFEQLLFEPQPATGSGARATFPETLEEWSRYRIVILGDILQSQLTAERQRILRQYVTEAGGNLVLVAGDEAMPAAYLDAPLGGLLPVQAGHPPLPENQPLYLHLSDEGAMTLATQIADTPASSEKVWREMSERLPIYGLSEFSRPKATAHSLIWASPGRTVPDPGEASTRSFLAWHYAGAGRVVYLSAPLSYQLRYRYGDLYHHRFWGQLLRWSLARDLAEGSRTVRLSTDKSRYEDGEQVEVSVRLSQLDGRAVPGAALEVAAVHEGRVVQAVSLRENPSRPGSYHALLEQLPVGPIKLQVSGDRIKSLLAAEDYRRPVEAAIHMDPSGQLELRHPLCNLPLLRDLADASAGMIVPATGLRSALQEVNLDPEIEESTSKMPLWNRWDLFWIFIMCLSLEWAGRKYLGLS
jgi:hypothetical protein